MFTVLRPESTLSAPPEQSESVRYQINQSTSIELERACVLTSWFQLVQSVLFHDGDKMFQKLRRLLQKLAGFESDARLRRANEGNERSAGCTTLPPPPPPRARARAPHRRPFKNAKPAYKPLRIVRTGASDAPFQWDEPGLSGCPSRWSDLGDLVF